MITFQDLEACTSEDERMEFVYSSIQKHKTSERVKNARIARKYYNHRNPTIESYERILYKLTGEAVVDETRSNYKVENNMFVGFVTQQTQFLLGNGITWASGKRPESLGDDFEEKVKEAAEESQIGGVAYGFFNLDHIEIFKVEEFAPIEDEIDGAMKAGIRYWQVDPQKPLRATLYELDGYTEYILKSGEGEVLHEKRPYIIAYRGTEIDGMEIYAGENYPGFPIVPFWGQKSKESLLVGNREALDAYDLIKSGLCNDIDEAQEVFWLIQNAGGMDEVDLAKFLDQIRRVKAAVVDEDGARAEPHTLDIPYQARETILARLEADLFRDFMAFDPRNIASGSATATQIRAGYEFLNSKTDHFEYYTTMFITGILEIAGIDDEPSYTRSMIVNRSDEISVVLSAASYLPNEYVTKKILTILGDADMIDDVLDQMAAEELERMRMNVELLGQMDGQTASDSRGGAEESV